MPYMMHKDHGFHFATGDEVEQMKQNGWQLDTVRFNADGTQKDQVKTEQKPAVVRRRKAQ